VSLLVRSWNVFHGNAAAPERGHFLERMIRLATQGDPDVVCLQEVPVWALPRLGDWSGMTAVGEVAARPLLGPIPIPAELGRRLTDLHHGVLRSAFSGQANAILLRPALRLLERHSLVLNPRSFRRAKARELALDWRTRLAWAKERRICLAVRVELEPGRTALVANLHATSSRAPRLADAELRRAAVFVDGLAQPGELVVLAGDFNLRPQTSATLAELTGPQWRFSAAGPWIDHVLVRGGSASPHTVWGEEQRRLDGRLLSDHAPVEVEVS
jgi:endonuclease/exonuclease/phosphatase family metal-dependent hydrolase